MESLIQIFRMTELSVETRIKIIMRLGGAIDNEHCMNVCGELVIELCLALDPEMESKFMKEGHRYHFTYKEMYR